jgi:hypothetical protein
LKNIYFKINSTHSMMSLPATTLASSPHAIYTLSSGTSYRDGHRELQAVPSMPIAYYNGLATRILAVRDGTSSHVHAFEARKNGTTRLHI